MTEKRQTSKFYCYDLVIDRIFSNQCAVKGCSKKKSKKQAVCDYHWNKIPDTSIDKMYEGSRVGGILVDFSKALIKSSKTKQEHKRLKTIFFPKNQIGKGRP